MSDEYKIIQAPRQVIENKLLDSLHEGGKVAALFDKADLDVLIKAAECGFSFATHLNGSELLRLRELHEGMVELRKAAFK